jgi:hypothetical protein
MNTIRKTFLTSLPVLLLLSILFAVPVMAWETERADKEFTGKVNLSGGVLIDETPVTASAAELNSVADGLLHSATGLNAVVQGVYDLDLLSVSSALVTNGQIIAATAAVLTIDANGNTATYTNTIAISDPPVSGYRFTISVGSVGTNKVGLADSGNLSLAGAWVGDAADTISLVAVSTTAWHEVSRSTN